MKYISEKKLWEEFSNTINKIKSLKEIAQEAIDENRWMAAELDIREIIELNKRKRIIKTLIEMCEEIGETNE